MYPLPPLDAFKDQFGAKLDFAPAPDLRAIADEIVDRYPAKFGHLPQMRLAFLWKESGGSKAGKMTLGKCQRPSGLLGFYSQADFVIWLAWDHVLSLNLTEQQVEAALFHELCHAGRSAEDGETPELWPHDVEMFAAEVREYGLWRSDLECLRQLGLFERVDHETGEIRGTSGRRSFHDEVGDFLEDAGFDVDRQTGECTPKGAPRGTHYRDDNPARPPMVCRDSACQLDHYSVGTPA